MPAERYYIPSLFQEGENVLLQDQEHHHLAHVMRSRIGDVVELVNGMGQMAVATIASIEKKQSTLAVTQLIEQPLPTQSIVLAQGLPRLNRLEFIIEKGTELGMSEIWLFPASRSEKKSLSENQLERLQSIAVSAMKQCGRLFLPKITIVPPIKQWRNLPETGCFFGDLSPNAPLFAELLRDTPQNIVLCIGPESGLTEEEIGILKQNHFQGVKLHQNVLRTDTAAIAALALASHYKSY